MITMALLAPLAVGAEEMHMKANIRANMKLRASTTAEVRTGTTTSRENKMKTLKERMNAQRENLQEKINVRKDEAENRIKGRFSDFFGKVIERFNATADRLDKIVLRIESRLIKLESEGANETRARSLLADAKVKLNTAKLSIANISVTASSTVSANTTLKTAYPAVKSAVEKAKKDLRATQDALTEVVKTMHVDKPKAHATSTNEANLNNSNHQ